MTFHDEGRGGHGFLFRAAVRVRFFDGAILLAAVLALAAGSARAQSLAPDRMGDGFSAGTALWHSTSVCEFWTEKPGAEAPHLCASSREPEGPRFHPPRASANFIRTTELISPSDSDAAAALFPDAAAAPQNQSAPYQPITGQERLSWIVKSTLWPQHLAGGVITSAVGTAANRPREDGPHWGGFGERFGVRLTGVATSNVMEAGIGALWGEDPRYFPVPEDSFGGRVKNVIKMTFLARRPDGDFAPAYARYIAFSGNNFLANAWRPDSEANVHDAVIRTLEGFGGRMAANAWDEFWPDAKQHIFHRGK